MMVPPNLASPTDLIQALTNVEASRYLSLASYALLLYDLVLTLPREISLVWTAKWSIVKILFLINRYTVPVVITANVVALSGLTPGLTVSFCQPVIIMVIYWQLISLGFVDAIVSLRIHALWQRRRSVFLLMSSLFVVVYTATLVIAIIVTAEMYDTVGYLGVIEGTDVNLGLCYAIPPRILWAVWLPLVLFEGVICTITFCRSWQQYSHGKIPFREALAADGLVYFLLAFTARLFDLFLWAFAPGELMLLGEHFAFVVNSVVCSRLLLNLRGVRTQEDWSEATDLQPLTSGWVKPEQPAIWLADQGGGGQSFLEQVYRRAYTPDLKPTFDYVD